MATWNGAHGAHAHCVQSGRGGEDLASRGREMEVENQGNVLENRRVRGSVVQTWRCTTTTGGKKRRPRRREPKAERKRRRREGTSA
eukprot:scaffold208_cov323-Pavlova_lutheri.AAC.1